MNNIYKYLIKNVLILVFLTSPLALSAGEAECQAINELLDITNVNKIMNDTIDATIQMIISRSPVSAAEKANQEARLRKFYNKYMSLDSIRNDVILVYNETFTLEEIKDMIAFYKTKTGQKMIQKAPEVMQRAMLLATTRVMQHSNELLEIVPQVAY